MMIRLFNVATAKDPDLHRRIRAEHAMQAAELYAAELLEGQETDLSVIVIPEGRPDALSRWLVRATIETVYRAEVE